MILILHNCKFAAAHSPRQFLIQEKEKKLCIKSIIFSITLTSTAPSDEPEVVEFGHLVLHDGRRISQLRAVVLVVSRLDGHQGAVDDLSQADHPKRDGKGLVGPPVRGQGRADDAGAAPSSPTPRMLAQNLRKSPLDGHEEIGHGIAGAPTTLRRQMHRRRPVPLARPTSN
ncbi:hypothetical protein CEXT_639351 [Caerostris extrusa]|uniref:Uncharacterized protein n=1 Tax=Caerostris extrusa TaxID=172846 RepID=A0AAV4X2Q0_CAEEX|nr:hypothetical protein CEXT_639351 [Caerostris extrusa]